MALFPRISGMVALLFSSAGIAAGWTDVRAAAFTGIGQDCQHGTVPINEFLGQESLRPIGTAMEEISRSFLGRRYHHGGPLGEGPDGEYDQSPLYRFDTFDCTTFVETTIALANSRNFDEFRELMNRIRYKNAMVHYVTRNHFPELDWIPNNVAAGFVADVTATVAGPELVRLNRVMIDKPGWYQRKSEAEIKLLHATRAEKARLLERLRREGRQFQTEETQVPYIPATALNQELLDRIPSGAVINIVRETSRPGAGSALLITHQGLAVRVNGVLYFRNASSIPGVEKVMDIPLSDYLARFRRNSSIRGINILEVSRIQK